MSATYAIAASGIGATQARNGPRQAGGLEKAPRNRVAAKLLETGGFEKAHASQPVEVSIKDHGPSCACIKYSLASDRRPSVRPVKYRASASSGPKSETSANPSLRTCSASCFGSKKLLKWFPASCRGGHYRREHLLGSSSSNSLGTVY
jgi:hypothetical protein